MEPRKGAPWARAVRRFLERAGPGFVKLGQVLSVRPDLVPDSLRRELEALQDRTVPVPWHLVRAEIERALGPGAGAVFRRVDPQPVASASVAQVHRAQTPDGRPLAVKVLRPGVEERVLRNLRLARRLAPVLGLWPALRGRVDAGALWGELERAARAELDLRAEGETACELARGLRDEPRIRIPEVYWPGTARRVLSAEWIEGHKLSAPEARRHPEYRELAEVGARAFFRQVLELGVFHADLHPANLLVTPAGEVGYVDFGLRGRLAPGERRAALGVLVGLLARDAGLALRNLEHLGVRVPRERRSWFVEEVDRVLGVALRPRLEEMELAAMGLGLLGAARRAGVRFPHRHALLVKALLSIEGTARLLHPGFSLERCAGEYLAERTLADLRPGLLLEAAWRGAALLGLGRLCAALGP